MTTEPPEAQNWWRQGNHELTELVYGFMSVELRQPIGVDTFLNLTCSSRYVVKVLLILKGMLLAIKLQGLRLIAWQQLHFRLAASAASQSDIPCSDKNK